MRFRGLRALASDTLSRIGSAVAASAKRKAHLDFSKQNAKKISGGEDLTADIEIRFSEEDFSPHDNASLSNGRADSRLNAAEFLDERPLRG